MVETTNDGKEGGGEWILTLLYSVHNGKIWVSGEDVPEGERMIDTYRFVINPAEWFVKDGVMYVDSLRITCETSGIEKESIVYEWREEPVRWSELQEIGFRDINEPNFSHMLEGIRSIIESD